MSNKWVGLLDCNNFFVSRERLFRPELEGKPVLVLSSNDGCVVARSQEVKDIGVPMGVPYFQIKDIIKNEGITAFSSHFALYRDVSRRVFSVMSEELGGIQQYSIDEAFFLLDCHPEEIASHLRKIIAKKVGIPVSIGLSQTRTRAKYANMLAKKAKGIKLLSEQEWSFLAPKIPLAQIWGVGGKMEIKYKNHNLLTAYDLMSADPQQVRTLFGLMGLRLRDELKGVPVSTGVKKSDTQHTILNSRSFKKPTEELAVLADAIAYHLRHAAASMRAKSLETRSIRVFIRPSRHSDFVLQGGSKEIVLTQYTRDTVELSRLAKRALEQVYRPRVPYKQAGVVLGNLRPVGVNQPDLFSLPKDKNSDRLMKVLDNINAGKEGKDLLTVGSRLKQSEWQAKSDNRSPAYTTKWSDILTVKSQ